MNIAELNDMIALGFAVKQWVMYLKVKTLWYGNSFGSIQ
jgi:hypothetical protein